MSNLELTNQAYQYFAEGNMEGLVSLWNEDIIWDECTGFPYVEGDGIWKVYFQKFLNILKDLVLNSKSLLMVGIKL